MSVKVLLVCSTGNRLCRVSRVVLLQSIGGGVTVVGQVEQIDNFMPFSILEENSITKHSCLDIT